MVFYFVSSEGYTIYMVNLKMYIFILYPRQIILYVQGADKYENEDLIRYGFPEDIWFHVDDLSSAHVYLRLQKEQQLEDVSEVTIMECCQLVKANSIEGCKPKEVDVIYTRWRNLHKTSDMEVGAIGFHDRSKIKKIRVTKDKSIVNQLNRTKQVTTVVIHCYYPLTKTLNIRNAFPIWQRNRKREPRNSEPPQKN